MFDDDDEELEQEEEAEEAPLEVPLEFGVDFSTGMLTGGKVRGAKAVAVWAWNALMYPRYRHEMATFQYGSELTEMIGQVLDEDEAAMLAESMIRDALSPNPYILDITDLECTLGADRLEVSFTIVTPFGEAALDRVGIY